MDDFTTSEARLVNRDAWLVSRRELLAKEKEFDRARDSLSAARRSLPLVRIEEPYSFDTVSGAASLIDLFGEARQLILYHFMFGPDWKEGCPSCSYFSDSFDRAAKHLAARDTAFACVSNAPLAQLQDYRTRMGWTFNWVSAHGTSFSQDFGVTFPGGSSDVDDGGEGYNYGNKPYGEECPGLSVFLKLPGGGVAHAYSTYARGLDILNTTYNLLDLTPVGRNETGLDFPMAWVKRRDQY